MKQIITALAFIALMHTGAEAQTCKCRTKSAAKHAANHTQKQNTAAQSSNTMVALNRQATAQFCRVVPYEVCSINPDRRSVSCYKTTDPDRTPASGAVTVYGPTGALPGETEKPTVETIIVNAPALPDYCTRNKSNNATVCYSPGGLYRDELGFYHYQ